MIHHNRFNTILSTIPPVNEKRAAVRVTKAAERAIRTGHPWLYESGITALSPEPTTGDLTIIFDNKRNFLAIGLYDHTSPIRIKIIHTGRPTPINDQFWRDKLTAAISHRASINTSNTTAYRLIHGENDGLPGLIVDQYEDTAVIKLYSGAWLPHLRTWTELLTKTIAPNRIILRLSRRLQAQDTFGLHDGDVLVGERPTAPILFHENGLIFEADVIQGQKTGHFLDQRDNRQAVRELVEERDVNGVLDVFGCTGGFSVYAAAGGAKSVTTLDRSAFALAQAERNMAHNHLSTHSVHHKIVCADAFTVLQEMSDQKRRFDLVILDPPSFAQKQADVENALKAYTKLARLGVSVTKRNGVIVLASCSSRVTADHFFTTVHEATGGRLDELTRTAHAIDHPITFPEGAYLKCMFATVS